MENEDKALIDGKIDEFNDCISKRNEQKLVILLTEIIVSITLRELYEKSD